VLQVHPTRRCNLRCLHCYSESGPEERGELPAELLIQAIADGAVEGYNVLGVSGGEPFMYSGLATILHSARALRFVTTVTTNGTTVTARALDRVRANLDLLAFSIDGKPESHDRMRNSDAAFERMRRGASLARSAGIRFGFIFTLTQCNVHELDWVARFAVSEGAQLLQIHPLEITGRARSELADERPDDREAAFGFVEFARLQLELGDRIQLQLDLADRDVLRANADAVFAGCSRGGCASEELAALVSPLIIEADATVVPIRYGFDRAYAIGNLHDANLRQLGAAWRADRLPKFQLLCRDVYDSMTAKDAATFDNWYERLADAASVR
jgi:Fe-coproporphyrin III synthase